MKIIKATNYQVEIGSLLESSFSNVLSAFSGHKIIIIVDENTHDNCLDYLITSFIELERAEIVLLPTGEKNKVMEVFRCQFKSPNVIIGIHWCLWYIKAAWCVTVSVHVSVACQMCKLLTIPSPSKNYFVG